nr:uncharacterized protein LOC109170783 [Ipomoea batatas]
MGCGVSSMMNADMMDAPSPAHGGRMIHPKRDRDRDDTIQYPASPSFRVYFKQNDSQDEVDGVKSMPYTSRESSITKRSDCLHDPFANPVCTAIVRMQQKVKYNLGSEADE